MKHNFYWFTCREYAGRNLAKIYPKIKALHQQKSQKVEFVSKWNSGCYHYTILKITDGEKRIVNNIRRLFTVKISEK